MPVTQCGIYRLLPIYFYAVESKILYVNVALQLFSYPSISPVSAMSVSGVISPTNLSLFTSPVTTPRTTPRSTPIPRWNAPFISLDEDYNMITPLMSGNGNNPEASTGALMDDGMSVICLIYTGLLTHSLTHSLHGVEYYLKS
jgi:hypothetical protein